MRQLISGIIATVAVMAATPAMACGYHHCGQPQVYVAPVAAYSYAGCNPCGGWSRQRLADPEQQYYYVNQGPTYTGPGNWAPEPTYQEGYPTHRVYRSWRPRVSYYHAPRHAYAPRYVSPYRYARPLRRYY